MEGLPKKAHLVFPSTAICLFEKTASPLSAETFSFMNALICSFMLVGAEVPHLLLLVLVEPSHCSLEANYEGITALQSSGKCGEEALAEQVPHILDRVEVLAYLRVARNKGQANLPQSFDRVLRPEAALKVAHKHVTTTCPVFELALYQLSVGRDIHVNPLVKDLDEKQSIGEHPPDFHRDALRLGIS